MEKNMQEVIDAVVVLVSTWGLQVLGAIALLIIGYIIAGMIRNGVRKGLEKSGVDATLVPFLSKMAYYLALGVVLIAVLQKFGVQTTSLVAVLGAAGLAVGLALQGTLSNFAAGVMLLIFRPFKVGDFVDVAGTMGSVKAIEVFTTTMSSPDNIMIIVPNSNVFGSIIKNFTTNPIRRIDLVIGISYDDDIQKAMDTIKAVITADDRVLADPELFIGVANLGDSSVDLAVRPWCNSPDFLGLKCDLTRQIKEKLEEAGCSIPYPQQDVHMSQQAN